MARKKKASGEGAPSGNEWLATFSDTMTLLLTFFILLYSFSSVDANKFKQISSALQSVLTGQSGNTILDFNMKSGEDPIIGETPKAHDVPISTETEDIYEKVQQFVKQNNLDATVSIKAESRGVVLQLKDSVLFESGKADIRSNSIPILDKLNGLINAFPNKIIVEGHTDNVPIKSSVFPSNWELSTQRAVNVLKYFVETKNSDPAKFQAAGYGEHHPIAPNDTAVNKAMNRRVTILIVAKEKEN